MPSYYVRRTLIGWPAGYRRTRAAASADADIHLGYPGAGHARAEGQTRPRGGRGRGDQARGRRGLDAVTMRAVAAELGIAPMSLYNYVPTKDHLIQLMIDMAGGEYRCPDPELAGQRAAIADLARQGRDITRRHPWLPDAIRRPAVIGPNGLRYLERFLGLLAGSGLGHTRQVAVHRPDQRLRDHVRRDGGDAGQSAGQHRRQPRSAPRGAGRGNGQRRGHRAVPESRPRRWTAAEPSRIRGNADEVFDSCVYQLVDGALSDRS